MRKQTYFYGGFAILAVIFLLAVFLIPAFSHQFVSEIARNGSNRDAISIAVQLGRLDLVSLAVAFLGLGVGFFAIFSFFQIRDDAKEAALKLMEQYEKDNLARIKEEIKNEVLVGLKYPEQPTEIKAQDVDTSDKEPEDKQDA